MPIILTEKAAKQMNKILAKEAKGAMIRLAVQGGGCSGFQYEFSVENEKHKYDMLLEREGAKLLIDDVSQKYLEGAQIDWVDELIGASFKINNPNATSSCGCGTSFSV